MGNITLSLPLKDAKGCHSFCNKLLTEEKWKYLLESEEVPEASRMFKEELNQFYSFMSLLINSEVEEIVIPDRYYRIFSTVTNIAFVKFLFG